MILNNIYTKEKNQLIIFFVILFAMSVLMIYCFMPLDKINTGYDMIFHYRRFNVLMENLKNNNYPVYIDFKAFGNYGYGTKWFYPDLILVPFAYLGNFTNFVFSYKVMLFIFTLLCGIITYKSVYYVYKNNIVASISSLVYTFSPYRLQDLYERSALGEALSFTFLPLVFLGLYLIIKGDYKKWYILSIGLTLILYTHLLSTILTVITIAIIICLYYKSFIKEPKRIYYFLIASLVAIVFSLYYILPMVEQLLYISFEKRNVTYILGSRLKPLSFIKSLFFPYAIMKDAYFMQPTIGIILTLLIISRIFIRKKTECLKNTDMLTVIGIFYLLLCLVPWNRFPLKLINFIQFPWRLFEYISFLFSISGAYYLSVVIPKIKRLKLVYYIIIIFITFSIFKSGSMYIDITNYKFEYLEYTENKKEMEESVDYNYSFCGSYEYFPEKLSLNIINERGDKIISKNQNTVISDVKRKDVSINFEITTNENDKIELPLTYYKGYTAKLNSKDIEVKESENGLVEIPINESGEVVVKFTGTFQQKYSIYITIVSLILLIIYIYNSNKKRKLNA